MPVEPSRTEVAQVNLHREPDDLGEFVVFLVSGASDYITGASVLIDGGFTISPRSRRPVRDPDIREKGRTTEVRPIVLPN